MFRWCLRSRQFHGVACNAEQIDCRVGCGFPGVGRNEQVVQDAGEQLRVFDNAGHLGGTASRGKSASAPASFLRSSWARVLSNVSGVRSSWLASATKRRCRARLSARGRMARLAIHTDDAAASTAAAATATAMAHTRRPVPRDSRGCPLPPGQPGLRERSSAPCRSAPGGEAFLFFRLRGCHSGHRGGVGKPLWHGV